ncbi:MAG TPA: hypothetical protein VMS38_07650 [Pseudorhodoferax sp.]|jgi:hypothetical protein|nr:hypothetical protein [Pseudorhodoferax sp.]
MLQLNDPEMLHQQADATAVGLPACFSLEPGCACLGRWPAAWRPASGAHGACMQRAKPCCRAPQAASRRLWVVDGMKYEIPKIRE